MIDFILILSWIKIIIGLVVAWTVFQFVLKPFIHFVRQPIKEVRSQKPPHLTLPQQTQKHQQEQKKPQEIIQIAKSNPDFTTQLVRQWLGEKDKLE